MSPQCGRAASWYASSLALVQCYVCHNLERQRVCSLRWYQRVDRGEGVQTDLINQSSISAVWWQMSAFAFLSHSVAEWNLHTWKRSFTVAGAAVKNHFHFSLVRETKGGQVGQRQVWMLKCPASEGEQVICGSWQRLLMLLAACLSSLQLTSCLWVFGHRICGCRAVSVKITQRCAHFCAWVHLLMSTQVLN